MTQEQKDLLLKDLCARLPYGVICKDTSINVTGTLSQIGLHYDVCTLDKDNGDSEVCYLLKCKPYLFPLSSMTEEQKEEIEDKLIFPNNSDGGWMEILYNNKYEIPFWFVDFCNKNHLDYRGLIPMGLANDATNLNVY